MEKYEPAEVQIVLFESEDVITTSNGDTDTEWA